MEEKTLLINSMQKLIKNVNHHQKSRIQIFSSLNRDDLMKIISNMDDHNLQLRKVSLILLIELMRDNIQIKQEFCKKINVNQRSGKILMNPKLLSNITYNLYEIVKILKQPIPQSDQTSLLWVINLKKMPPKIEYVYNISNDFDPKQNLYGIIIPQSNKKISIKNQIINNCIKPKSTIFINQYKQPQKYHKLQNFIQCNNLQLFKENNHFNVKENNIHTKYIPSISIKNHTNESFQQRYIPSYREITRQSTQAETIKINNPHNYTKTSYQPSIPIHLKQVPYQTITQRTYYKSPNHNKTQGSYRYVTYTNRSEYPVYLKY